MFIDGITPQATGVTGGTDMETKENLLVSWLSRPRTVLTVRLTKFAMLATDLLALLLSGLLATFVAVALDASAEENVAMWMTTQSIQRYWAWFGIVVLGLLLFLSRYQHYSERKPFWRELGEVFHSVFWLALLDMALMSIARWNASRLWWLLVWVFAATLLPLMRSAIRRVLLRYHLWQRPTVLIGAGPNAVDALAALASEPLMGFEPVGCIAVRREHEHQNTGECRLPPRLTGNQFHQLTTLHADLQVVIALEHQESLQRDRWLRQLAQWKVQNISVIPAMRGVPLYGTDISYFFSHEVALLRVRNNLRHWPARLSKRIFDVIAASFLLALLTPLMLLLAWRIRQDSGPAVFAHHRVGQGGKLFPCYKFRSMVVDANVQLERLLESNPELRTEWERDHKLKDDPRISLVGHFLRKTSLDELPQLLNVLRGEMSLVGPRPIVEAELERYGDDAEYFLMVRPGITGLWQVSGRNDVDYDTRVYLDTWYVKNWSLWYDIAILFKTVRVVLRRDGAY